MERVAVAVGLTCSVSSGTWIKAKGKSLFLFAFICLDKNTKCLLIQSYSVYVE